MGFLKEKWSEAEVAGLPDGEHNYFDRKSGKLFADKGQLYSTLAKALSAFANSGGGHLILGQENDGRIEGVPAREGRTETREWLEQKLPMLVSYPLESFRVHNVTRDAVASQIPIDKELLVIDVGDSRLAPHQAAFPADAPQYYYRQGGKSVAAPHHYLEAIRNRLTFSVLDMNLESVKVGRVHSGEPPCRAVVEIELTFLLTNISRVACYKWTTDVAARLADETQKGIIVTKETFPRLTHGRQGIPIDTTILPTRTTSERCIIGFKFFGFEVYSHCLPHHAGKG